MPKLAKSIFMISFFIGTLLSAGYAFAVLDADIISHTIPASVHPGDIFQVSITILNTCTEGEKWVRPVGAASTHRLYSQTDPTNLWGPNLDVLDPGDSISPGMYKTFTLLLTAPSATGLYPCKWQMAQNVTPAPIPFGELLDLEVEVTDTIPKILDAAIVSHTIPSVMCAGETRSISITMRNTGSTSIWYRPDFRIYAQNAPQPDNQWVTTQILLNLNETIHPGATRTFTANITAPATPGSYNCNWRMRLSPIGVTQFFGPKLETVVSVVGTGGTCDDGNECTGDGTCSGVACSGASPVADGTACNAANPCTTYTCTGGICGGTINPGSPCDDGNNCTAGDTCSAGGVCTGTALDCSGLNDTCNAGVCNPYTAGCIADSTYKNATSCDDGTFCNGTDTCWGGACEHTGDICFPETCDEDNDICGTPAEDCADGVDNDGDTFIDCADADCDGKSCDDADACTSADICAGGVCAGGATVNCDDSNSCTDDSCDSASGCVHVNNTAACDDGIFCNGVDSCADGSCSAHAGDPCTPLPCNEENDQCTTLSDIDADGVPDISDNCPSHPNGPALGTCILGTIRGTCLANADCGFNGICSLNQDDSYPPGGNGLGDACECEGDFDCDRDVDGGDAVLFKRDFGRSPLTGDPCPACAGL